MRRTPGLIELSLQPLVLAAQLIALSLDPFEFALQPLALNFGALGAFAPLPVVRFVIIAARRRHAIFMADSRQKYKYGLLDSARRDRARVRTR
jgi:hypothetical protein